MNAAPGDSPLDQFAADSLCSLVESGTICLVAVSGGGDSLALLDLLHLARARHGCPLAVAHVDHGIGADSAFVASRVAAAADSRGLALFSRTLALGPAATETVARRARRAALIEMADQSGARVIVLGHHADDQAETVLLRLLRGSGPAGLAGMSPRHGVWVRPLLGVRRSALAAWLVNRKLQPWSDPANADLRHLRSWLRAEVVPRLAERLPDTIVRINRSATLAADARAAWADVPSRLAGLDLRRQNRGISVAAAVLSGYRSPLRHAVLAALARESGVIAGTRRLAALDRLLQGNCGSASIAIDAAMRAELAFGRLTLYKVDNTRPQLASLRAGVTVTAGRGSFATRSNTAGRCERIGWDTWLEAGRYTARPHQHGDRIRPLGGNGTRAVGVMMREARVPPSQRREWPVVVDAADATIVWVPGICRADARVPSEGTEAWHVECAFA